MEQSGSQDITGSSTRVPGYTLDRGVSVDRAGALVDAHDTASGSPVAIRLLSPALSADAAFRRQVRRDMAALAVLRHQHVLAVIAFDDRDGAIVYEAVDGVTLRHVVDVTGALPPAAALVVFDDCLSGLEALHAAGVIHRDVRPDAVTIDTGGTAILRDAGVPAPPLHHGWRAGTPQYMAPELWASRPHTIATDLYAATGVLVEALTGDPPYLGTDLTGLGVQHTQGAVPSEAVPMIARALVVSGLAKDPRDRPASASLFRRDVEIAGTAFLGASWRDRGRAWLASTVADRIGDPAPTLLPVDEFVDEDDDLPLPAIAIDTAADERPPGGVGWKTWSVAGAAVLVLVVVIFATVNALGGSPVQLSPTPPTVAAPLFTPTAPPPTDDGTLPTDTAAPDTSSPSPTPRATPTPTAAPNSAPVTLAPKPTPTATPSGSTPTPSPTH
ncbi:MAG: protein kinase [Candidatus Dormiibacterota bacterium]